MITSFFIGIVVCFQNIRKEKQFHHDKKDKQFYKNNYPEFFSQGHASETIVIKIENPDKNISFLIHFINFLSKITKSTGLTI